MAAENLKDEVYREPRTLIGDFKFDRSVAGVFDDMVSRSVPFYGEMQRMIVEMARDFAMPGTNFYDLGCSTGTTFANLDPYLEDSISFVGIDNADHMLEKCRAKLVARVSTVHSSSCAAISMMVSRLKTRHSSAWY